LTWVCWSGASRVILAIHSLKEWFMQVTRFSRDVFIERTVLSHRMLIKQPSCHSLVCQDCYQSSVGMVRRTRQNEWSSRWSTQADGTDRQVVKMSKNRHFSWFWHPLFSDKVNPLYVKKWHFLSKSGVWGVQNTHFSGLEPLVLLFSPGRSILNRRAGDPFQDDSRALFRPFWQELGNNAINRLFSMYPQNRGLGGPKRQNLAFFDVFLDFGGSKIGGGVEMVISGEPKVGTPKQSFMGPFFEVLTTFYKKCLRQDWTSLIGWRTSEPGFMENWGTCIRLGSREKMVKHFF
jgi:hypothetical protein